LVFSSCAVAASFAGAILAVRALVEALASSGFTAYASLIVSDHDVVFASGNTFLATLLESLPGPEVVIALAVLAVLIQSLRVFVGSLVDRSFLAQHTPSLA